MKYSRKAKWRYNTSNHFGEVKMQINKKGKEILQLEKKVKDIKANINSYFPRAQNSGGEHQ
ncbi:MAG: hypothetical protein PHE23_00240 [Sulfuricurvum sp.]|nr:hypothetical protein [Sulfuricurvum sp.]